MKPGGYIIIVLILLFGCAFVANMVISVPQVNEVFFIHQDQLVNPTDFSTSQQWYVERLTQNCTLKIGAVKIVEGPKNGLYLLDSGNCQGWGPREWLHKSPARN